MKLQICLLVKCIPIFYFNTTAIIRSVSKIATPKSMVTGSYIAFRGKWGLDTGENCTKVHCYAGLNPVF
jgi:hypothetical protein